MDLKKYIPSAFGGTFTLAAKEKTMTKQGTSYINTLVEKTVFQTRKDIKQWKDALDLAANVETPKRYAIYNIYKDIMLDMHLQSQVNNRMLKSLSQSFIFKDASGKINQELTDLFQNKRVVYMINKAILESVFYGHSLGELDYKNNELVFNVVPRTNVDPKKGLIYYDYTDDGKKVEYRNVNEYGSWLIEFGENDSLGLLNGVVPHVLFKKFAQSCWSELCEIYGIPPRVLKTNTQDRTLVSRGQKMMQDMGSAAWFIIDSTESFEWAKGVNTNGDVYQNLLHFCNNEISMGISGANVGQDTKNGSNSKEQTSISILQDLIDSDLSLIEMYWNSIVIPALKSIGVITQDVIYAYPPAEDLDKLWKMTTEAANFLEVDPNWVKNTFGVQVLGSKKTDPNQQTLKLSLDSGFF
ncbi:MAG: DUF935 family protein [Bacteroidetes bacterium]|nr:DUF935 family protein [Bacteroidota bacterium]